MDTALVVDPRVELPRQHHLLRIGGFTTSEVRNYTSRPNKPYIAFIHDRQIAPYGYKDEIESSQIKVTALYIQHPEFFKYKGFSAPGSRLAEYGWESFHSPALIIKGTPEIIGVVENNPLAVGISSPLLRGKKTLPLGSANSIR